MHSHSPPPPKERATERGLKGVSGCEWTEHRASERRRSVALALSLLHVRLCPSASAGGGNHRPCRPDGAQAAAAAAAAAAPPPPPRAASVRTSGQFSVEEGGGASRLLNTWKNARARPGHN